MTTRTVYQLSAWSEGINARELVKETARYYTFRRTLPQGPRDDREYKNSAFPLHETWAGAHAQLLRRTQARIDRTRHDLKEYEARLVAIQAMKQP